MATLSDYEGVEMPGGVEVSSTTSSDSILVATSDGEGGANTQQVAVTINDNTGGSGTGGGGTGGGGTGGGGTGGGGNGGGTIHVPVGGTLNIGSAFSGTVYGSGSYEIDTDITIDIPKGSEAATRYRISSPGVDGSNVVIEFTDTQSASNPVDELVLDGVTSLTFSTAPLPADTQIAPGSAVDWYITGVGWTSTEDDGSYTEKSGPYMGVLVNPIISSDVACYARGTRILTVHGEVAVEDLQVGDRVVTFIGQGEVIKTILWLGHRRIELRRHPDPENTHPIRFPEPARSG